MLRTNSARQLTWATKSGGIIGARLWHILTPTPSSGVTTLWYLTHPLDALAVWKGGLGILGAVVGGLVALYWYTRKHKLNFAEWTDIAAPGAALGQAIGRWGNFFNQELYGWPTDLPWGIAFPQGLPPTLDRVHPTQIYEAIALFVITWLLVRWRRRGVGDLSIFGRYLVLVGVTRFLVEIIRVNVRVGFGLTVAQFFAVGGVVLGIVFLLVARARRARVAVVSRR